LRRLGHTIHFLDAGGGLGIQYRGAQPDFAAHAKRYAQAVLGPIRDLDVHLLLEPGRILTASAGILLTSVLYTKQNRRKRFAIVDAAMNDLIRPALYGAYHEIVAVQTMRAGKTQTVDVVGPVCESGDFLGRDRRLPAFASGDLLAVLDAGAYGSVLSSNYNARPRAAEVLVEGKSARKIRRRETIADLIRAEVAP
jgi:diaminopimelate decarboxylase